MENNCMEEYPSSHNYKSVNFSYNNQKYEINVSLYSNAVMIFICYNAKLANMYELNIDLEEEQEKNVYNDLIGEENEVKDIDIAECILGKRGNERFNFMANFIISYIKDIILKINNKINKICLSLNLDEELTKNLDNNSKEFLDIVKDNINKIFSINKK